MRSVEAALKKRYFDKANLKSKLFKRMFLSYVMIIVLLLVIYSLYVVLETRAVGRERQKQYYTVKLEEIAENLNRQFALADNIVANINSSETVERYILETESSAASEEVAAVNAVIKAYTRAAGNFNIVGTYLLLNGTDKVFSNTAAYSTGSIFDSDRAEPLGLRIGSLAETCGIEHSAVVFHKSYLLYLAKYENVMREGRICILFDLGSIADELGVIMENDEGVRISVGSAVLYEKGTISRHVSFSKKTLYSGEDTCVLAVDASNMYLQHNTALIFVLVTAFVLGLVLILAALALTNSYYGPLGSLSRIMADTKDSAEAEKGNGAENELERIIRGIEALIGERNGYQEKMVSIKPYVRQGMLYGIMNGSLKPEKVDWLLEDEYTVLQMPYFTLGVLNIAYVGDGMADEVFYKEVKRLTAEIAEENSEGDLQIVTYDKDINNIFMIVNSNDSAQMQQVFYNIYDKLTKRMGRQDYAVTIGVDITRETIDEITVAVNGALKALENIMIAGRGTVYFAERRNDFMREYYFPKDTQGKILQALKEKDTGAIRTVLGNIVAKNMNEYDLSPDEARLLVDEIHITTVRTVREANRYNNIDFDIKKPDMIVPLEEIAQYYCAIFETVCGRFNEVADQFEDMCTVDEQIIACIDREFAEEKMSLQYLTEQFKVSNKYITMLCKKRLGKTYLAYIQEKRIYYAVKLMKNNTDSLETVAKMCGYTNLLTFRRNFKAVTGVNPSEYDLEKGEMP